MKDEQVYAGIERRGVATWIERVSLGLAALAVVAMDVERALAAGQRHSFNEVLIFPFLTCILHVPARSSHHKVPFGDSPQRGIGPSRR